MSKTEFYFALPRLLARWLGCEVARSERNWLEANFVGTLVHLIAYACAYQLLLIRLPAWQQFLWALPLAFLVWVFWLLALYFNSLLIKLLRGFGLTRDMPDRQAQSFIILLMTTVFAWQLGRAGSWLAPIGLLWIGAVALNLLAAVFLRFADAAK